MAEDQRLCSIISTLCVPSIFDLQIVYLFVRNVDCVLESNVLKAWGLVPVFEHGDVGTD